MTQSMFKTNNIIHALIVGASDVKMAKRVIKVAGILTLISAALTFSFAVIGLNFSSQDEQLNELFDPWLFLVAGILLIGGVFLLKQHLWAAISLIVLQSLSALMLWIDLAEKPGAIFILKMLIFVSAARAIMFIKSNPERYSLDSLIEANENNQANGTDSN